MIRSLAIATLMCSLPSALVAEEGANTILVLDASGSMWGQIDGVNKIVIARDVVDRLLEDFPAEQNLGLTVYGHRRRGDCSDIETLVTPGPETLPAISSAVGAINPRGKTPMTDAIIAAAEALRYTEEKATVILVSDGIETCNPDPCAAARALEEAGIDFTAHVVGFDVTDPEALAQMQCLAENTGGTFTTAANAEELTQALTTVAVAPEPEPEPPAPVDVTFEARLDAEDGPLVEGPVLWSLAPLPEGLDAEEEGNGLTLSMVEGSYEVTAYWAAAETEITRQFIALPDRTFVVVFETPAETATLTAPATAPAGATIEVGWNGPGAPRDLVGVTDAGAEDTRYPHRFSAKERVEAGNPLRLRLPTEPGDYVVEYALGETSERIGSVPITLTPVEATLTAPATVEAGARFEVAWTGPAYERDMIGVTAADQADPHYPHRFATRPEPVSDGTPLRVTAPTEPGQYVLEYAFGQNRRRLVAVPLEVVSVSARLTAPATAVVGETIEVGWTGPGYDRDIIAITPESAEDPNYPHRFASRKVQVSKGNPAKVQAPTEPGRYVIEYALGQDTSRLVSVPLEVTPATARLTAPASAAAGSVIEVAWTGPGYARDFVGVTSADQEDPNYPHRFATRATPTDKGNPARVQLPTAPGRYVVEYALGQDRSRLTAVEIEVTPVTATLTAPASAAAGSTIEVAWTGPGYPRDMIAVTSADAEDPNYAHRFAGRPVQVSKGSPLRILLPETPGTYVIEYVLGLDRVRLNAVPITVE
ncbi:MAG: VWA domain-containing protein [Pseudomonadota bacterium]